MSVLQDHRASTRRDGCENHGSTNQVKGSHSPGFRPMLTPSFFAHMNCTFSRFVSPDLGPRSPFSHTPIPPTNGMLATAIHQKPRTRLWSVSADAQVIPARYAINCLLKDMGKDDRSVADLPTLARPPLKPTPMLADFSNFLRSPPSTTPPL